MKKAQSEIRYTDANELDEVVASNVKFFHLEQMDDGHWWMKLDLGGGKTIDINLHTRRNAKIIGRAERDI